jgi:carbonic anhydrase
MPFTRWAKDEPQELPRVPARRTAIVTCMDARIDPLAALGMHLGDAHVIRNAGALVTDDTIRSLAISQRMLDTRAVVIIGHTDCGLEGLDEGAAVEAIAAEAGTVPPWRPGSFASVEDQVRASVEAVRSSPFIPHRDDVTGFVHDVGVAGGVRPVA